MKDLQPVQFQGDGRNDPLPAPQTGEAVCAKSSPSLFWVLLPVVVIVAILITVVTIMKAVPQESVTTRATAVKCISDECIHNLQLLDQIMHFGIDPCMTFHSYVCGRFTSPEKYMLAKMNHNLATKAYETALDADVPAVPLSAEHKAHKLFRLCLDLHSAKRKQPEALVKILDELKLNPASIKDEKDEDPLDRMMGLSFTYGVHTLLEFVADSVVIVKKKRLLRISVASEEILWHDERKNLVEQNELAPYYTSRFVAIGVFSSEEEAKEYVPKAAELESTAIIQLAESAGTDFTKPLGTISVAVKDIANHTKGQVDADKWQSLLAKHAAYGVEDRAVVQPVALKFLKRLLGQPGAEGVRRLLSWSLVRQWAPLVDGSLDKQGPLARNVSCVDVVLAVLRLPFMATVLFDSISTERLRDATRIATTMRDTFSSLVANFSSLNDDSKQKIMEKLQRLKIAIGFPESVDTVKKVDALYAKLALSKATLFENWLEASKYKMDIAAGDNKEVLFDATSSMVFYEAMKNEVVIPAGALLPPLLYSPEGATAYNYGSFGQYVAVEMARGFGPRGKNSNYEDQLNPWVNLELKTYYDSIKNCLKESWDVVKNDHLPFHKPPNEDSSFVLDEETAFSDLLGTRVAFEAYRKVDVKRRMLSVDPDRLSPPMRQFFVGSCVKWCLDANSNLVNYAGPFRCVLPLVHIGEFSDTINCGRNSKYASMAKCSLY